MLVKMARIPLMGKGAIQFIQIGNIGIIDLDDIAGVIIDW